MSALILADLTIEAQSKAKIAEYQWNVCRAIEDTHWK